METSVVTPVYRSVNRGAGLLIHATRVVVSSAATTAAATATRSRPPHHRCMRVAILLALVLAPPCCTTASGQAGTPLPFVETGAVRPSSAPAHNTTSLNHTTAMRQNETNATATPTAEAAGVDCDDEAALPRCHALQDLTEYTEYVGFCYCFWLQYGYTPTAQRPTRSDGMY